MPSKRPREEDEAPPHLELVVAGCGAGDTAVYEGLASSCFLLRARHERVAPTTTSLRAHEGGQTETPAASTTPAPDFQPLLVVDLGFGATRAIAALCADGKFPIFTRTYISHNHSDHSAELPVVAAVDRDRREAAGRGEMHVIAERGVARKLIRHRLDELRSVAERSLEMFVSVDSITVDPYFPSPTPEAAAEGLGIHSLYPYVSAEQQALPWELGLWLQRARHSELCYGFVLYARRRERGRDRSPPPDGPVAYAHEGWEAVLGWSGDSAADDAHYTALARAPIVLVDARPGAGTSEHASVAQVLQACEKGGALARCKRVVLYGYGGTRERAEAEALVRAAPASGGPAVEVAVPGTVVAVPWPADAKKEQDGEG